MGSQADDLEQLVGNQQRSKNKAHPPPVICREGAVKEAAQESGGQKGPQPDQMGGIKRGKPHALGNGFRSIKKIAHGKEPFCCPQLIK